jgi:hypothetical protein
MQKGIIRTAPTWIQINDCCDPTLKVFKPSKRVSRELMLIYKSPRGPVCERRWDLKAHEMFTNPIAVPAAAHGRKVLVNELEMVVAGLSG